MIICRTFVVEFFKRCGILDGGGGTTVEKMSGGGEGFGPIWWRHVGMKEEGADRIVESTKNAFRFAILLRGVWTRKPKEDAVVGKEFGGYVVNKFGAIVRLN